MGKMKENINIWMDNLPSIPYAKGGKMDSEQEMQYEAMADATDEELWEHGYGWFAEMRKRDVSEI